MRSARDDGLYPPDILYEVVPPEVLGTVVLKDKPFAAFQSLKRSNLVLQFDHEDVTTVFDPDVDVEWFVYS